MMRSAALAVIAGAVILVAVIAVMVRVQRPQPIGGGSRVAESPRTSRMAGGTNREAGQPSRSELVQERLRQLRERHAERRESKLPAVAEPPTGAGPPPPAARELPPRRKLSEVELEVAALENTLLSDPDPEERAGAAFFLSTSDDEGTAYRVLLRGLNDPDPEVRLAVIESLEDFDQLLTADALAPALNDPDPEVRFEVVSLLGDLETPEALAVVQEALEDPDEDVRTLAEGIVELTD